MEDKGNPGDGQMFECMFGGLKNAFTYYLAKPLKCIRESEISGMDHNTI